MYGEELLALYESLIDDDIDISDLGGDDDFESSGSYGYYNNGSIGDADDMYGDMF